MPGFPGINGIHGLPGSPGPKGLAGLDGCNGTDVSIFFYTFGAKIKLKDMNIQCISTVVKYLRDYPVDQVYLAILDLEVSLDPLE